MSFAVRLSTETVHVDPGTATPIEIEVENRSEAIQQFDVAVEGIDPEWVNYPVPSFRVEPGEKIQQKVFLKPPRQAESLAGNYPFVVRVRSLESGEGKALQGVAHVKTFNHLSMEVTPKRGRVSSIKRGYDFQITLLNLGNTEHTVRLIGSDPDNACAFEFEHEEVTLHAGAQTTLRVTISATSARFLANPRLHGFTIVGRSTSSSTAICSAQGQLEQRATFSPSSFVIAMVMLLLALGWWYIFPKDPSLDTFILSTTEVPEGESLTVSWRASHAERVELYLGDRLIYTGTPNDSYEILEVREAGILRARAFREGKRSPEREAAFRVIPRERAEPPQIFEFALTPNEVEEGEPLMVTYRVSPSVTRLTLEPIGQVLNLAVNEREISATRTGEVTYTLVAENSDGEQAKREFRVKVKPKPDVALGRIWKFEADPIIADATTGRVTISWQVFNAVRAELSDGFNTIEVEPGTGYRDFIIQQRTTFTLTITDANGRTQSERLEVDIAPVSDPGSGIGSAPPPLDSRPASTLTGPHL